MRAVAHGHPRTRRGSGRSTRSRRSSGTVRDSGRRTDREKTATASTTVATTKASSIQRYAPTSYSPSASARPTAARASVAEPPEGALEQHRAGDRPGASRVAPGSLEDPRCVTAHGRRQHLPCRVADEVRPRQPAQAIVDRPRLEQPLPAPRHRQHGHGHDRHRRRQPPVVRLAEDVDRLVDVDLPDDVGEAEAGDGERRGDPHAASLRHASLPVNLACTRRMASIASAMSSSEWAAESGSDSTSFPARSATGNGCWSG